MPRKRAANTESARHRLGRLARSDATLWDRFNNGFVARRSRSLARVACGELVDGVPRLKAATESKGKFSEYFSEDDQVEIRRHDLDFILRFAYRIIRGDILTAARYRVWSFHHGDEKVFRGRTPHAGNTLIDAKRRVINRHETVAELKARLKPQRRGPQS